MNISSAEEKGISRELLKELPHFESFAHKIGLKRVEGAVYGLLALCNRPLTSEEIQDILGLSQSAVAQTLKVLAMYNAIETKDARDLEENLHPRTKAHSARLEGLAIAASLFRKREQEAVEEFRKMAVRLSGQARSLGDHDQSPRMVRFRSIINTATIAESVMHFVIELSQYETSTHYPKIVGQLPRFFQTLLQGEKLMASKLTSEIKSRIEKALSQ